MIVDRNPVEEHVPSLHLIDNNTFVTSVSSMPLS